MWYCDTTDCLITNASWYTTPVPKCYRTTLQWWYCNTIAMHCFSIAPCWITWELDALGCIAGLSSSQQFPQGLEFTLVSLGLGALPSHQWRWSLTTPSRSSNVPNYQFQGGCQILRSSHGMQILTRVLIQFDIAKNIAEAIWSNGEKGDFGLRIKESVSSSSMAIMQAGCIG